MKNEFMKVQSLKTVYFFAISLVTLGLFFAVFYALQDRGFYHATVGLLESTTASNNHLYNYFMSFSHDHMKSWDSIHYFNIGTQGYTKEFEYAFFPLYPFLIGLVPDMVFQVFLNYALYSVGLYLILKSKPDFEWSIFNIVALFCAPFLFVILIPYSEALMIFCFGVGWYLKYKQKSHWIYMVFFIMAGMIRASNVFMLASFGLAGLFVLANHKKSFFKIIAMYDWVLYVAAGVLLASIIQVISGAPHLLFFAEAQSYWKKELMFPTSLGCWSEESLGMNFFGLFVVFPFMIYKLKDFFKDVREDLNPQTTFNWAVLVYLILLTVLIYMTQMGSLNGLFRYVCCTPFFLLMVNKKNNNLGVYALLFLTAFLFFNSHPSVHGVIGPSQLGFFIFFFFIMFVWFNWQTEKKWTSVSKYVLLGLVYFVNLIFTAICVFKFLSNSYVIT